MDGQVERLSEETRGDDRRSRVSTRDTRDRVLQTIEFEGRRSENSGL